MTALPTLPAAPLPSDDQIVAFVRGYPDGVTTGFAAFRFSMPTDEMRTHLRRLRDEGRLTRSTVQAREKASNTWRMINHWKAAAMIAGPCRIQRRRTKGWTLPPNTVTVTRPSVWGNPFEVDAEYMTWLALGLGLRADRAGCQEAAVRLHRAWLTGMPVPVERRPDTIDGLRFDDPMRLGPGPYVSLRAARDTALGLGLLMLPELPPRPDVKPLRGKNLACFCSLCERHQAGKPFAETCPDCDPCHADPLGEAANR
jgi:hypothetical protein